MATAEPEEISKCPNCERPTPPEELSKGQGVCKFCLKTFSSAHRFFIARKGEVVHPEIETGKPEAEPSTGFNWDELYANIGEVEELPDPAQKQAAEALARIFNWVWHSGQLKPALVKFSALCAGLRPELLDRNYPEIAKELGVTKAAVSKQAVNAEKTFSIRFSRSRSDDAKANMAKAARGNHNRRRELAEA